MLRTFPFRPPLQIRPLLQRVFRLFFVLCLLPVAACTSLPDTREWTVADLRLLDPVGDASAPSTDILAVYTRTIGSDFEIRVDLLDIPITPDYTLLIYITPAPFNIDPADRRIEISIPHEGKSSVFTRNPDLDATRFIPRIIRDPWLDTVLVRFNKLYLPADFKIDILSMQIIPGQVQPLTDYALGISPGGSPPLNRAPVVLAFWDSFPAATPAQALRRWDGAHTGPRGERHGLKHILDNAGVYGIPVALLDLKNPASLAALDYLGLTPQLQSLASHNLLILPDTAYAEPADVSLDFSRRAAAGFGLPASQFVYNASARLQAGYLAQFYSLQDTSHISQTGRTRLIPLPAADLQATTDGLSLDVRRALMEVAFSTDPSDLVVLGGALPSSTWGNENIAAPTFAWIAAHPWIRPLTGDDLLTFPVRAIISPPSTPAVETPLLDALKTGPANPITDSAWQTYLMLTAPTGDEKLLAVRSNYLGQVGKLLAGAQWAANPSSQANCDHDLNGDGLPECVLSSRSFYAILDPAGARLTELFYLDAAGPHQLVAPSSQYTVGLSDPSEWHPELGLAADPGVIPGAFSDAAETWTVYDPAISIDRITFSSPDGSRIKAYRLLEDGIEIDYQVSAPLSTRIPLAVDSQAFYFRPTSYTASLSPDKYTWGLVNGIQVNVSTDAVFSVQSFTDSFPYLSQSENPDRLYPAGHYVPFPLSVLVLDAGGNFSVQIIVK